MKPYPKYKPTNIDWIGEIPEHWMQKRVKNACEIFGRIGYRGYTVEDIVDEGKGAVTISPSNIKFDTFTLNEFTSISWDKYFESPEIMVFKDDIILVKTGSTIGKTAIIPEKCPEMTINPQLVVLKKINLLNKYFYFQTVCDFFKDSFFVEQTGSTTPTISQDKINCFPVLFPPLPEQQAIVSYLDQKTALIDELIAKKQRKIELLKENRTALINHAVTKGLDPTVKYKDSGIEWIGEIPEHWEVKKMKYFAKILNGKDYQEFVLEEGGYPVYGTGGAFARCSKFLHDKTSVLLGRKGSVENPQFVTQPFWTSDTTYYTEIFKSVVPMFFFYLVKQINFKLYIYGSAIPSMTKSVYDDMYFPSTYFNEQQQIADYLDIQTSLIDQNINLELQKIDKLKEYRQSLISNVVTGKICVLGD